jgi:membrane-bound lytic murein transglycosylase A
MRSWPSAFGVFLFLFTAGCATAPVKPPVPLTGPHLIRLAPNDFPSFEDDLDTASLRTAALQSAAYFQSLPQDKIFVLASDTFTARDFAESMNALADLLSASRSRAEWLAEMKSAFQVYQSAGVDPERKVTFSSYYEPTLEARLKKDARFRFPIYGRPDDLVDVDLGLFDPVYEGARVAGRREGRWLVPYHTRADIDSTKALARKGLEIAWAKDPVDIFFLQIEGSGWLDLGGGQSLRIRYDGNNGKKYKSVGQHLIATGRVRARGFGHKEFVRYMARHPKERQALLNVDERYIFFRIDTSTMSAFAFGNIDVPLTPGRSIATDPKLFPKGMLAWIDVSSLRHFVLNQDEGGAIQGPGRVDVFAGSGPDAERFATHFWYPGRLYFLVKKKN